jgi:hypothetical protein
MNLGKVLRVYVIEPIKIPVPSSRREEPVAEKQPPVVKR